MKTMKRIAALLLTLCLLVGLPISVSHAADTPLTIVKAEPYEGGMSMTSSRIAVKFSEEIAKVTNSGLEAYIAIYRGSAEGQYRYKWNTSTNTCTAVSGSGSTADGWSMTRWSLGNPRHAGGGVNYCGTHGSGRAAISKIRQKSTICPHVKCLAKCRKGPASLLFG